MKIRMLPSGSVWRTVLLVISVAAVDILLSIVSVGLDLDTGLIPEPEISGMEWARFGVALLLAPVGALVLIGRHRFPKTTAVVTALLGSLSFSGLAFVVALFLLAKRRFSWPVAGVIAVSVGAEAVVGIEPLAWPNALFLVLLLGAIAVWGAYRGQRARLLQAQLATLQERAERSEAQRSADSEQSKLGERHRIAREMHDTLAHRMSLVAVQAAALQVAAPDTQTLQAAKLIRETAHAALGELRDVLGVLHEDGISGSSVISAQWRQHVAGSVAADSCGLVGISPSVVSHPTALDRTAPPGLEEIGGLVSQWRQAGVAIDYSTNLETFGDIPDAVSRAAYRVVQEGITNVARHAPETEAVVRVELLSVELLSAQTPTMEAHQLRIVVSNGHGISNEPAVGAGTGLIGLGERIKVLNGTLQHGPSDSGFQLQASIPVQLLRRNGATS